jgi:hypothetical protein
MESFGTLSQSTLVDLVAERVADSKVLRLGRQFPGSGVLRDGKFETTVTGVPQGGVASSLLSNIYLHVFDVKVAEAGYLQPYPRRGSQSTTRPQACCLDAHRPRLRVPSYRHAGPLQRSRYCHQCQLGGRIDNFFVDHPPRASSRSSAQPARQPSLSSVCTHRRAG